MNDLYLLSVSAVSLGIIHTLLGPDHYLPFIVLSKARKWTGRKTMWITFISGIGHVGSSILIGIAGIALGISLNKLEAIEAFRGQVVAWILIGFGLIYSIYGLYRLSRHNGHTHLPGFLRPKAVREAGHGEELIHKIEEKKSDITPWILFLIFVFGPCEVLIPLLIFPAAANSVSGIVLISLLFAAATIFTMLVVVYLGVKGASFISFKGKEHYVHLFAGMVIMFSGIGIQFLGL